MTIKAIDWVQNYNGFIGTLNHATAAAWLQVIDQNIPDVRDGEIDEAVADLCGEVRGFGAAKPNALTIIHRIKDRRRGMSGIATPNEVTCTCGTMPRHTTMAEIKRELCRRPTPDRAWSLICAPQMAEQSRELMAYCDRNGIEYRVFEIAPSGRFAALVGKIDARRIENREAAARERDYDRRAAEVARQAAPSLPQGDNRSQAMRGVVLTD